MEFDVRVKALRRLAESNTGAAQGALQKEIDKVKKLSDADRATLRSRLAELDSNGTGERLRMDSLELASVEWLGQKNGAKRYEADQFVLISAAPEEATRRRDCKM